MHSTTYLCLSPTPPCPPGGHHATCVSTPYPPGDTLLIVACPNPCTPVLDASAPSSVLWWLVITVVPGILWGATSLSTQPCITLNAVNRLCPLVSGSGLGIESWCEAIVQVLASGQRNVVVKDVVSQ
uniref:Uncharacterized protein n=1 Tax=Eutreptiella gymnastica TaxID=73025 RepID=A0A7S1II64_9EUGL|mmetsp:Transcript_19770/g.35241  ORF Transcript_19770/g.35241 Transcript_19770/m.35241 type:complete len:127 (+) Transcript_19770:398-778(+)